MLAFVVNVLQFTREPTGGSDRDVGLPNNHVQRRTHEDGIQQHQDEVPLDWTAHHVLHYYHSSPIVQ